MAKFPIIEVRTSSPRGAVDAEIVPVFHDKAKKRASAKGRYFLAIERLSKAKVFLGELNSALFLRGGGKKPAESALMIGLGVASELTEEKARVAGGHAWSKLKAEKSKTVLFVLEEPVSSTGMFRAFAEGLVLGNYHFDKYKTGKEKAKEKYESVRFTFVVKDEGLKSRLDKEVVRLKAIMETVNLTRDWSNEPSNFGTPDYYASEAKSLAERYGLKCTILDEADAANEKMGLFLGVGQGAEREGKVVVLEYLPRDPAKAKTIAFVGKGVTFDSGGVSIKPALRMEEMKHDMTGAATIMGAILLAARWKVRNRVIAVMAFTENMPDGNAIQPGNVLTSRAGKTVEIINTDAEGRLILADVLDYAQDFAPDAVVDAATLTGAVSIALGKHCCAVLGNDESLIEHIRKAGEVNGERIWQLPLYDEYFDDLKSDTADMRNSANDSNGGVIRGAMFLKQFIKKGVRWAHLDIAAMANGLGHVSYYPKKGASGAYVRTLAQFAEDF